MNAVEYYQDYIAHFGIKGQTKGLRRYQSYETAPTRSGMVGQEVGEAAKQRSRKERDADEYKEKLAASYKNTYTAIADSYAQKGQKIANKAMKNLESHRSEESKKKIDEKLTKKATEAYYKSTYNRIMATNAASAIKNMSVEEALSEKRIDAAVNVLSGMAGFGFGLVGGVPLAIGIGSVHYAKQKKRMDKRIEDYTYGHGLDKDVHVKI